MYYFCPDYTFFQPTVVFFSPFMGQEIYYQPPTKEYEITDHFERTQFSQSGKLFSQSHAITKEEPLFSDFDASKSFKTQKHTKKKLVQKVHREITDVYNENSEAQEVSNKKKKSTCQLFFGVEWKNQNRNIIPNIMNQIVSFIQKRHKSEKIVEKLFQRHCQNDEWTVKKYFCYMKLMKSAMGHYINENDLKVFSTIRQPGFFVYSEKQQRFYLKICRMALDFFLRNESIFISLTSKRMSHQKRKAHLIARRALLQRFQEIVTETVQ